MPEVCGCLGCTDQPFAVVEHPSHGERTVCQKHALNYEVTRYV